MKARTMEGEENESDRNLASNGYTFYRESTY